MYLAYTIPHLKWQVPDLAQYENKDWPEKMKIQAAMVSRMSKDIGAIANLLVDLGIDKNTLIFSTAIMAHMVKGEVWNFLKHRET